MKGYLLDLRSAGKKIEMFVRNSKCEIVQDDFEPYFYFKPFKEMQIAEAQRIERGKGVLKIITKSPEDVAVLREHLKTEGEVYEADIQYIFRYLIDKNLYCSRFYEIPSFKPAPGRPELKMCAFDIETASEDFVMKPEKNEILMISYCNERGAKVLSWRGKDAYASEKEMIAAFVDLVKKNDPDVITGYNSSAFDFPFLKKRCQKLGIKLDLGRDGSEVKISRRGIFPKADIFGRVHLDGYKGVELLTGIGAMRLPKNDLESVYKELTGNEKIEIEKDKIMEHWNAGGKKLETLIEYNKQDAIAAYKIAEEILPLYIELSRITGLPIYEISNMTTAQMVEWLLIREANKRGELIPQRPEMAEVRERMMRPIKGAFVKLPERGLHKNIVVCDFRSLYPSLIMTYNIDGSTANCKCCKDAARVPEVGHWFCKKKRGLIPQILEELVDARVAVKKEMKTAATAEKRKLHFEEWGLKILANSAYGYLGFGRARWYSREAAESVTALGRHYIQDTAKKAEESGFNVLYCDTDSLFLKLGDKKKEDATKFVERINSALPEKMELEFEGFYPRGIFVTKRGGGAAAKKRYALIREDGTIEIKGFEFVRRDWARIAKKTQEEVITAVLREGDPEKAKAVVKKIIADVKNRKVDLRDLVIYTQIVRKIESYEQQAPHVKAAKKLVQAGYKIRPGSVIEYVVVEGEGSISDRSIPVKLLEKKKYDPEYYIKNQILPATMKILMELGVEEEELIEKHKQSALERWT